MKFRNFEKYTYIEMDKHRKYLEELKKYVSSTKYLPKYHIYPECGLLNDPNGLSYYNNEYHVFYQWYPFEATHGMKHWAHVKSKDLINWSRDGNILIPNLEYEKNGCYSGNAIEKDGDLYIFYTANYKTPEGKIPKQALAIMNKDGIITKYEKNPIIDGAPEGMSGEIRDPFVFERNGKYFMLLGGKSNDNKGKLILYVSKNLMEWKYKGIVNIPHASFGYMLECPSFCNIDGKDVLIISPMGLEKKKYRYNNEFSSVYMIGNLDVENMIFNIDYTDELDCGFDFYAPQVFYGKDKEPIMFAWFGCGEQDLKSDKDMWKHSLTMPRILSIKDNRLYSEPIKGFKENINLVKAGKSKHISIDENSYMLSVDIKNDNSKTKIIFGREDIWSIEIDFRENLVTFDRSNLDFKISPKFGLERIATFNECDILTLDIFVDNSFIEVYVGNGERTFTARVFNDAREIEFISKSNINYKLYDCSNITSFK